MGLKLITPPEPAITLAEAKAHLNVDFDDDDDLITAMVAAATGSLDGPFGATDRALMPQTWDYYRDAFPCGTLPGCGYWNGYGNAIRLPLPPLISVDSVNYIDADTGLEVVLDPDDYAVDTTSFYGWLIPATTGWPSPMATANALRIRFTAGYPPSEDSPTVPTFPAPIKAAIMLILRDLYDNRGTFVVGAALSAIPDAVDRLIKQYRLISI